MGCCHLRHACCVAQLAPCEHATTDGVCENPDRANYTGQPVFPDGTHTAGEWFIPKAFAAPAPDTFGNLGRNAVYGPGMQTLDFALGRDFGIRERMRLHVRMEAFNGLNKVNLGTPNRFVHTAQFGTITE
jgi:hypothetical protein